MKVVLLCDRTPPEEPSYRTRAEYRAASLASTFRAFDHDVVWLGANYEGFRDGVTTILPVWDPANADYALMQHQADVAVWCTSAFGHAARRSVFSGIRVLDLECFPEYRRSSFGKRQAFLQILQNNYDGFLTDSLREVGPKVFLVGTLAQPGSGSEDHGGSREATGGGKFIVGLVRDWASCSQIRQVFEHSGGKPRADVGIEFIAAMGADTSDVFDETVRAFSSPLARIAEIRRCDAVVVGNPADGSDDHTFDNCGILQAGIPLIVFSGSSDYSEIVIGAGAGIVVHGDWGTALEAITSLTLGHKLCATKVAERVGVAIRDSVERLGQLRRAANRTVSVNLSRGPRVLAFCESRRALGRIRCIEPLEALVRLGEIDGFVAVDSIEDPRVTSQDGSFDLIWIQRRASFSIGYAVQALGGYLFDLDDNLLANRTYQQNNLGSSFELFHQLNGATVITVSTPRLRSALCRRMPAWDQRMFITPNALNFSRAPKPSAEPPTSILLASSDNLPIASRRDEILSAIGDFAGKNKLAIRVLGNETALFAGAENVVREGVLDYLEYVQFLCGRDRLLPVVPVETAGDPNMISFINCKSDVKMVEYGGLGHIGVYSATPYYIESDIRNGVITSNTYNGWQDAMSEVLRGGFKKAEEVGELVRHKRDMTVVAKDYWAPAVREAILDRPVRFKEVMEIAKAVSRTERRLAEEKFAEMMDDAVLRSCQEGKHGSADAFLRKLDRLEYGAALRQTSD